MKTYKVAPQLATSLRRWLLWTMVAAVGLALAGGVAAVARVPGFGVAEGLVLALLPSLAHAVVMVRAVWSLWEWPGLALWAVVMVVAAIASAVSPALGIIIGLGFFVYVYTRLGRQTGQAVAPDRDVFEE